MLRRKFGVSERRACKVLGQPRSSQRFKGKPREDEGSLVKRMLELARSLPRFGYRRIGRLLRREGWRAGQSRVFRLWQREGLKVPVKKRKKRRLGTSENGCHRRRAAGPNDVWCWDFVFDRTASGSPLKWLSIVDEYTRECLALRVNRGVTSEDVIDTLAELFAIRGVPNHIRSDNGPEFIADALRHWLDRVGVETLYIEPGSPWENGYAESFHSRFRDEFLGLFRRICGRIRRLGTLFCGMPGVPGFTSRHPAGRPGCWHFVARQPGSGAAVHGGECGSERRGRRGDRRRRRLVQHRFPGCGAAQRASSGAFG